MKISINQSKLLLLPERVMKDQLKKIYGTMKIGTV